MKPFILLQLSDLHFGENSRFYGLDMAEVAARCAQAIGEARRQRGWEERVALVLVTGDIAEAARPSEYESAISFFAALTEHLKLPRSSVVFTPGNHDVSWSDCKKTEIDLDDGKFLAPELRNRLDKVKLSRFTAMVAKFYSSSNSPSAPSSKVSPLALGAFVHDFETLRVSVAALNSCEVESHRDADHRGHISQKQAQAVLDHWRKDAPQDRLRIVAVHHNPVTTIPEAVTEWKSWLRTQMEEDKLSADLFEHFAADITGFEGHERLQAIASDAQVSLLFHGHHHASDSIHAWRWRGNGAPKGDTSVLSAGSWSLVAKKLPAEQPLVMQLVRVDPGRGEAYPILLRYERRARASGTVEPGDWVIDEATANHPPLPLSVPADKRGKILDGTRSAAVRQVTKSPTVDGALGQSIASEALSAIESVVASLESVATRALRNDCFAIALRDTLDAWRARADDLARGEVPLYESAATNNVVRWLYEGAKMSVFSTCARKYLEQWPTAHGQSLLEAHKVSRAEVKRVFLFKSWDEVAAQEVSIIKEQADQGIIVYVFIDDDSPFDWPQELTQDFTVIDDGAAIGVTTAFLQSVTGDPQTQATWYFENAARIGVFRALIRNLERESYNYASFLDKFNKSSRE